MVWTQGILLCLCVWTANVVESLQDVKFSQMPDAFDDQYIGCTEEMEKDAPKLMEEEMKKYSVLKNVWNQSKGKWDSVKTSLQGLPRGFKEEHGRAIIAYTDNDFHAALNQAVRESGRSQATYKSSFHFKAFHYYLTRALQLLRSSCNMMSKTLVYRGITGYRYQQNGSDIMRFGYFASSSLDKTEAKEFGEDTFFTICTCFGVDIRKLSHFEEEEEVLIPIHEIFQVFPGHDGPNSFELRSTNRTCSHFNCAYLGNEKKNSCEYNAAWSQGITFLLQMRPSLFGVSILLLNAAALKLFAAF